MTKKFTLKASDYISIYSFFFFFLLEREIMYETHSTSASTSECSV